MSVSELTMAFLQTSRRTCLRQVEILGPGFHTKEELSSISKLPGFHVWSELGYYEKVEVPYVDDVVSGEDVEYGEIPDDLSGY